MRQFGLSVVVLLSFAAAAFPQTTPQPAGWAVLPVGEYRALRDAAFPPTRPPDPPPVGAAISRVEYDLAVQGETAIGQARLTVDVFKEGWVSVPIPAGLRVTEATIDGRPVTLIDNVDGRGSAGPTLLLSRVGRAAIALDVVVPVVARSGVESITLPPSPSPVENVELSLKSPDLALTVSGGFIAERTPSPQSTRFLVCGRPSTSLGLSWSRRRDNPAASQPLRLRGAVTEVVGLAEDSAQVSAQVSVEVTQGVADRVTLKLPRGFTVSQVSGALVADWEARDADLIVSFLEPVDRATNITLTGEARTAREGQIPVPVIRLAQAERETGGVAVEVLGAGEIKESSQRALDAADASDLGPMVLARQSPALVTFRSRPQPWDAPRSLDVNVVRYTPQAVLLANIDEARYTALFSEDGKTLVEAAYAVRNSQRSFLAITLPSGATLWSASIDGRPVRPGRASDGALLLPILKDGRSKAASAVRLFYVDRGARWASDGLTTLRLPAVDLPVSRTGVLVHHSPRYRLKLEPGPFRATAYEEAQSEALRSAANAAVPPEAGVVRGRADAGIAGGVAGGIVGGLPEAPPPPFAASARRVEQGAAEQELRDLVGQYQLTNRSGAIVGLLPVQVQFPALGPTIYAAAELTPERQAPEVRFSLKREVK